VNAAIDRARNDLTRRIATVIGGDDGAVAAALVTGKRGLISEDANEALRGAGIYHVVSISGLHMVLAAGLFMWTLRAFLSLFPAIALNYPVKKIAAAFAMCGATAYCIFSGSEVATERSLIMILVMLGAVLVDRPALSMRNLAVAALIVMLREPESVMGPSFQMSFGAVAAMIALFEQSPQDEAREFDPTFLHRALRAFGLMILTTCIAGLATGPFASFHFHRINPYSMIGNALTLPLVEFIVMPAALLGVVLGPLGLDAWVWQFMGLGISGMMDVSRLVAALHGSTRYVETFGFVALLVIACGLLFLCLWRSQIRWFGAPLVLAGLWLAQQDRPPDLAVDARARSMAVRGFSGKLEVLNGKGNEFAVSQWLLADADARKPNAADLRGASQCDPSGCITHWMDGRVIAFVTEPQALAEDCARADVVVTRLYVGTRCHGPELILDGAHFAAHGATELRLRPDGTWTQRVSRVEGTDRPWHPHRQARFTRAPVIANGQAQDDVEDPRLFSPD
jgi:competence protein ComEC